MNATSPVDSEVRRIALDPQRSFICEAPAGSGKTELLTQRVLTLLAQVDQPESILAITFTRKAAAEMRDRILVALNSARASEPQEVHARHTWGLARRALARDLHQGWNVLSNPNRLQIRTFDSLCSMLTQSLPLQSLMGGDVRVSEDAAALYAEAVSLLMQSVDKDVFWSEALANLLEHMDNRYQRVEELLIRMLHSRDAWMPIMSLNTDVEFVRLQLETYLSSALNDKKTVLSQLFSRNQFEVLIELGGFAASNLSITGTDDVSICALSGVDVDYPINISEKTLSSEQWQGVSALLLTKSGDWRKKLDKRCGFPVGEGKDEKEIFKYNKQKMLELIESLSAVDGMRDALLGVSYWPEAKYRDEQWNILESLTLVLPVLVAQLQLVFKDRGEVDFLEMSFRARQALGDDENPTDLALRLDHTIEHILADEFQDTSFTQIELLQKLTLGWCADDGRTLFCVGDAMQSIYGFRGANVGLFLYCKKHGLGDIPLHPIQLSTNFRSQAGIVEWVNNAFSDAFPEENNISSGAVKFNKADPFQQQGLGVAVQTYLYAKDRTVLSEGEKIVELVRQHQHTSPDGSVAILVRSKKHAEPAVIALRKAGIRYRAVDLELLSSREVIQDLLSLTQALLYREDRIAWLSALRAPWCGLSLGDLLIVSQQVELSKDELFSVQIEACLSSQEQSALLSDDGFKRLNRCFDVLSKALQEKNRKPLRLWIEGVWVQLGGVACLSSESDRQNALRFFDCLESLNSSGELPTRQALLNSVDALFSAPDPEADGKVQIMTIHKSKGLEFDLVILPSLHKVSRGPDTELLIWQERLSLSGEDEWLLAPVSEYGQDKDPTYRYLEYEKSQKEHLEACRLLYVACTRAKKQLCLLAGVNRQANDKTYIAPSPKSLLFPIWPSIERSNDTSFVDVVGECINDVQEVHLGAYHRLPASWILPELKEGALLSEYIAPSDFDNQKLHKELLRPQSQLAKNVGILIHRILQVIGEQSIDVWKKKDIKLLRVFWLARLVGLGTSTTDAESVLDGIVDCIQGVLVSEYFEWLLQGDCQFELGLARNKAGVISEHIIDLLRVDKSGHALIVDYKTSVPADDESLDAFLKKERVKYLPQLDRYRSLVYGLGYKSVSCSLYFVLLDRYLEY